MKGKAELLRAKKNLESEINMQIDEEQRNREEFRENYLSAEKRLALAQSEKEDIQANIMQTERLKKQQEAELAECKQQSSELTTRNANLKAAKKKLEAEMQLIRGELDETLNELKASEERSKKANADAARLGEELRQEQEHG
ncbi:unnamed protein product, partial [Anisakis simplex]|uniref:Myosin_tail_1 domain-containing protein n=1 Tax=Anisakis simplex TaxID=6269 RepID=A0A0M3KKJ3_ANISI